MIPITRRRNAPTADNRKLAVYVRKSKVTETGKSIEIQIEKCVALACARFDVTKDDIIIYKDEGKSGFYADRKDYRRMLADIEANKIRAVICYKIDRISRRTIDLLNLVQQMEQKDIAFISVSDNEIDTSSRTGKIVIAMLSAIAEFERDIIAERITDNLYELAKEGRWLGGNTPLGYYSKKEKYTIDGKKTNINHLEPIEDEQRVVKRMFELFLQKSSLTGTATALNKENFSTKNNLDFALTSVKKILTNPVYAIADENMRSYFALNDVVVWADEKAFDGVRGVIAYNKTEQTKELDKNSRVLDPKYNQKSLNRDIKEWIVSVGKHKGIISGADWIRVQNLIADIAYNQAARPKESTHALLSGLVRCVKCGSEMHVKTESNRYNPDGSLRFHYACNTKRRKDSDCKRTSPNVKGYELDEFVAEKISAMNTEDSSFYNELMNTKNILLLKSKDIEAEMNSIKKRLAQIEIEIKNQTSNLRTAPASIKQAIYDDIETLDKEREEKQKRLVSINEESKTQDSQIDDIEKAKRTILDFPRLIKLVDYEGRLQLLRRIVECIIVKDGIVHIFLKGTNSDHFFVIRHEGGDLCHTEQDSIFYTCACIRCKFSSIFYVI